MIIVYILAFFALLVGSKPKLKGFNEDYLSREQTASINGFFVFFVFCRHCKTYVTLDGNILNRLFFVTETVLYQLIVVTFLFYSGYGIIKKLKDSNGGGVY